MTSKISKRYRYIALELLRFVTKRNRTELLYSWTQLAEFVSKTRKKHSQGSLIKLNSKFEKTKKNDFDFHTLSDSLMLSDVAFLTFSSIVSSIQQKRLHEGLMLLHSNIGAPAEDDDDGCQSSSDSHSRLLLLFVIVLGNVSGCGINRAAVQTLSFWRIQTSFSVAKIAVKQIKANAVLSAESEIASSLDAQRSIMERQKIEIENKLEQLADEKRLLEGANSALLLDRKELVAAINKFEGDYAAWEAEKVSLESYWTKRNEEIVELAETTKIKCERAYRERMKQVEEGELNLQKGMEQLNAQIHEKQQELESSFDYLRVFQLQIAVRLSEIILKEKYRCSVWKAFKDIATLRCPQLSIEQSVRVCIKELSRNRMKNGTKEPVSSGNIFAEKVHKLGNIVQITMKRISFRLFYVSTMAIKVDEMDEAIHLLETIINLSVAALNNLPTLLNVSDATKLRQKTQNLPPCVDSRVLTDACNSILLTCKFTPPQGVMCSNSTKNEANDPSRRIPQSLVVSHEVEEQGRKFIAGLLGRENWKSTSTSDLLFDHLDSHQRIDDHDVHISKIGERSNTERKSSDATECSPMMIAKVDSSNQQVSLVDSAAQYEGTVSNELLSCSAMLPPSKWLRSIFDQMFSICESGVEVIKFHRKTHIPSIRQLKLDLTGGRIMWRKESKRSQSLTRFIFNRGGSSGDGRESSFLSTASGSGSSNGSILLRDVKGVCHTWSFDPTVALSLLKRKIRIPNYNYRAHIYSHTLFFLSMEEESLQVTFLNKNHLYCWLLATTVNINGISLENAENKPLQWNKIIFRLLKRQLVYRR